MTEEEKDLLLKDLCARLPHHVKVRGVFLNYNKDKDKILYEECDKELNWQHLIRYGSLKPYLRPLSSMTDEEQTEFRQLIDSRLNGVEWKPWSLYDKTGIKNGIGGETLYFYDMDFIYDYLISHHFDYRGLIPMGLALPAAEGMYN